MLHWCHHVYVCAVKLIATQSQHLGHLFSFFLLRSAPLAHHQGRLALSTFLWWLELSGVCLLRWSKHSLVLVLRALTLLLTHHLTPQPQGPLLQGGLTQLRNPGSHWPLALWQSRPLWIFHTSDALGWLFPVD